MATQPVRSFQDLEVWRRARKFAADIYRYSAGLPKTEIFGLTSQMRRAAVSVAANIAEGFSRASQRDKQHFYNIAQGSLGECHCLLVLASDLGWGDSTALVEDKHTIARMLYRLVEAVGSRS